MRRGLAMGVTALLLAALAVVVPAPPAGACQCMVEVAERVDVATTIFSGVVRDEGREVEVDLRPTDDGTDHRHLQRGQQIVLDVERVWRGEVYEEQAVVVWPTPCGISPEAGASLVVLGFGPEPEPESSLLLPAGVVRVDMCSALWIDIPGSSSPAEDELARLGDPTLEPRSGASPMLEPVAPRWFDGPWRWRSPALLAGGTTMAAIGAAAFVARRRRRTA